MLRSGQFSVRLPISAELLKSTKHHQPESNSQTAGSASIWNCVVESLPAYLHQHTCTSSRRNIIMLRETWNIRQPLVVHGAVKGWADAGVGIGMGGRGSCD